MARPSPAALDVMEHIAEAMEALDVLKHSMDDREEWDVARELSRVRDELQRAKLGGAEVLLELLNLSEQQEMMQGQIAGQRPVHH